jgi:AcrR family transcriptional regulator
MIQEKPIDRRIQRTRKLLLDSLIALILEKGYDAISVQDIIDKANIGRSTFYTHFENKEQLLFSGHERLTQSLLKNSRGFKEGISADFFAELYQHAADSHLLAKSMLGKGGGDLLVEHFRYSIEHHFIQQSKQQRIEEKSSILYSKGFASAIVGMLAWWIEQGLPISVNDMTMKSVKLFEQFVALSRT